MLMLLHPHCLLLVAVDEVWNIWQNITQDLAERIIIEEQLLNIELTHAIIVSVV